MDITLIAAMSRNGVIGDGQGMPWRLSSDLRRFRRLTTGKPLVMGRKTAATLAGPLPGRDNIVLTRDPAYARDGFHVAGDPRSALELAERFAAERGAGEVMVIGGGEIYRLFLTSCVRVYLTIVEGDFAGSATFPFEELCGMRWRVAGPERVAAGEGDSHGHRNYALERAAEGTRPVRELLAD